MEASPLNVSRRGEYPTFVRTRTSQEKQLLPAHRGSDEQQEISRRSKWQRRGPHELFLRYEQQHLRVIQWGIFSTTFTTYTLAQY